MFCQGCKDNLSNQSAHLDGCLKQMYRLEVLPLTGKRYNTSLRLGCLDIFEEVVFENNIKSEITSYAKAIIEAVDYTEKQYAVDKSDIVVYIQNGQTYNILTDPKKCKMIDEWTFYFGAKERGLTLKVL